MHKKEIILATIGTLSFVFFIGYSIKVISKPKILEVQGEVDATQIKVASKLPGRIQQLLVHKGNSIKQGQLLYTFSSPEIDAKLVQANAALNGAEAQNQKAIAGTQAEDVQAAYNIYRKSHAAMDLAKKTFERINNLYKDGVVPAQKNDEAETQYIAAVETEKAAEALWVKAKKGTRMEDKATARSMVLRAEGAIQEVNSFRKEASVYAPMGGEIANIIAESGELVSAGYPVVTIVNLKDVWVTFNLREDLLADIKMGTVIESRFPALDNKLVKLKVSYIHALGDFATWNATKTSGDFDMKTFEVHAVPVEHVEDLRPGMSAIVDWTHVRALKK